MELVRQAQVGDTAQSIGSREIYDRDERVRVMKMEEDII